VISWPASETQNVLVLTSETGDVRHRHELNRISSLPHRRRITAPIARQPMRAESVAQIAAVDPARL
jgi:hypothetical protein